MARQKSIFMEHDGDLKETDGVRLNKYIGDSGVCSRREADKLIAGGKVTVNGARAEVGTRVFPGDCVICAGKEIKKDEKLVLIAFHKPVGIECTTDRRVPDNVIDYLNYGKRIFPIGRLDKDSEGLLLLTNDGDIVNKILRAKNFHEKEYIVTVNKEITPEFIKGMSGGVPILDTVTRPCKVTMIDKYTFRIILTQGLNRQIRRMCEYFGYRVLRLVRVRIMNILLGHLQCGGYRNVTEEELKQLVRMLADSEKTATEPEDFKQAGVRRARSEKLKVTGIDQKREQKPENRGTKSENRGTKPENRGTKSENRGTKSENRGTKPENRSAKSENREAKPDNRGHKSGNGSRMKADSRQTNHSERSTTWTGRPKSYKNKKN